MERLLVVVMVIALVGGVSMILFAWRVLRRDRAQSEARVAHLQALANAADADDFIEHEIDTDEPSWQSPPLFGTATPAATPARWGTLVMVVVMFMSVGAASVYALYGRDLGVAWPAWTLPSAPSAPLELLSLTHQREPSGDFVVTGLVQNPTTGRATPALVAVVYLFNPEGEYFTSARTTLEGSSLAPGDQSPFTIRLPNVGAVSRYRLGFRLADGGVFAHEDRRGAPVAGTTTASVEGVR